MILKHKIREKKNKYESDAVIGAQNKKYDI